MKAGSIILWFGAIVDIPDRWVLCDGNNGTPDLRDKFVIGAGNSFAVGAVGGNATHNHTFTSQSHFHVLSPEVEGNIEAGEAFDLSTDSKTVSGTTNDKTERPPYHALCYIMYTGI